MMHAGVVAADRTIMFLCGGHDGGDDASSAAPIILSMLEPCAMRWLVAECSPGSCRRPRSPVVISWMAGVLDRCDTLDVDAGESRVLLVTRMASTGAWSRVPCSLQPASISSRC